MTAILRWLRRSKRAVWRRRNPTGSVSRRRDAHRVQPRQELAECGPRAHRVGEHAARHATLDGTGERVDYACGHVIVGEDVEEQVHVRLRGIDVGDEPVDDALVVGEHLDRIAAEDRHLAQRLGEANGRREFGSWRGLVDRRAPREPPIDGFSAGEELVDARLAQRGQPRPADQQVERQADRGLEEDQQQPAFRGVGGTAKRHDYQHADPHDPFGSDEGSEPRAAVGQEFERHRLSRPAGLTAAGW